MPGSASSNVAFLISHDNQLKLYLPILLKVEEKNTYLIFHKTNNPDPLLKKRIESKSNIKYLYYSENEDLNLVLRQNRVDILVTENISYIDLKQHNPSLQIFYLQHSHDIISAFPSTYNLNQLLKVDKFLLFSEHWKERFIKALVQNYGNKPEIKDIENRIVPVGFPELEQISSFSNEIIKEKYNLNIPKGGVIFFDPIGNVNHVGNAYYAYFFKLYGSRRRKLLIFLKQFLYDLYYHPLKVPKILKLIIKIYLTKDLSINYLDLLQGLRRYCDENEAILIIKSRKKNNDPDFIRQIPDYYFHDLDYYPFTLLELLYVSNFYIGFNSTATLEAISCKLNGLQLNVCPEEFQYHNYGGGIYQYLHDELSTEYSWINYPDLIQVSEYTDSINDILTKINFENKDSLKEEYISKHLIDLDNGSRRVLKEINNYFERS